MGEYPKALYAGNGWDCEAIVVLDADQEEAARAQGYVSVGESYGGANDMESLTAEAESLGVKIDKRWGAERLAAEIAKAKE
jgi:hypothetical protein